MSDDALGADRDEVRSALGELLREARLRAGLTQERVAQLAGSASPYVSDIERGIYNPTVGVLVALCRAIGVRPSAVLAELERKLGL